MCSSICFVRYLPCYLTRPEIDLFCLAKPLCHDAPKIQPVTVWMLRTRNRVVNGRRLSWDGQQMNAEPRQTAARTTSSDLQRVSAAYNQVLNLTFLDRLAGLLPWRAIQEPK